MRRVSLLLVAVLSASFLVPASAMSPRGGAVFNVPNPYGNDAANFRIVKKVERAIRNTVRTRRHRNPVIHISTYLLDRPTTVRTLIAACRRGVQVRVILDEDIESRPSRKLITALNADNVRDRNRDGRADTDPRAGRCNRRLGAAHGGLRVNPGEDNTQLDLFTPRQAVRSVGAPSRRKATWGRDGSYVKRCEGSCRGVGGNMHSKFYLFSRTKSSRHIVMVSSSNLNSGGGKLGWNDMYVVKRRKKLYRGFKAMHRLMTDDVRAGGRKVQVSDGPYVARFFPMRNASKATDPTLRDLKRIRCRSAFGRTRIHISMFYWKGERGAYLLDKVAGLARDGCKVRIIYGAPSRRLAERMRNMARRNLIGLWDSRWDYNDDGLNEVRTHAKYVLVKGTVGKNRRAHRVWTGSQNWVGGSLFRSDETTLNIGLRSAYVSYRKNWDKVRNHSRRLPYDVYGR
ncbi:phospholipase D-like domain-containing protein [Nocardioides bizhenqiangii]|uniref:Phospholipase D-like domain-containing protein n=1 Tax=Nocardioides bizhenqiangii TaxID=3095076 RepID=A0ABZ0ZMP4_9ACTN|nr:MULTISPECIES: phospholipase D-like domain-containing protein [unclassified Nocardioides]MDZ5621232.1 phospholipase D-like domain-containing protein [Nocardioides sp. HM23]WQQ25488.1 phospholipase D-like domain-containing protein [Nocardioides sp. HM61]